MTRSSNSNLSSDDVLFCVFSLQSEQKTEIQIIESGSKDVSSLEGTTAKNIKIKSCFNQYINIDLCQGVCS